MTTDDIPASGRSLDPETQASDSLHCLHVPEQHHDSRSTQSSLSCETTDHNVTITSGNQSWLDIEAKKTSALTTIIGHSVNKNCENFSLKESFLSFVPLLQRVSHGYSLKGDFVADVVAGITIAILQIPQGIAYALLVGVAPAFGLYTSFFPVSWPHDSPLTPALLPGPDLCISGLSSTHFDRHDGRRGHHAERHD